MVITLGTHGRAHLRGLVENTATAAHDNNAKKQQFSTTKKDEFSSTMFFLHGVAREGFV